MKNSVQSFIKRGKVKNLKKNHRINILSSINEEKILFQNLIERQKKLRLNGIDTTVIPLLNKDFTTTSKFYLGEVQAYLINEEKLWKRVGLDLPVEERSYNNILKECVELGEQMYDDNKILIVKNLY